MLQDDVFTYSQGNRLTWYEHANTGKDKQRTNASTNDDNDIILRIIAVKCTSLKLKAYSALLRTINYYPCMFMCYVKLYIHKQNYSYSILVINYINKCWRIGRFKSYVFYVPDDACKGGTYLPEDVLEPCSPHHGYDYFAGYEASYIIVFVSFGLLPFCKLLCLVENNTRATSFYSRKGVSLSRM